MSLRAHIVDFKIGQAVFNLWHDEEFMDLAYTHMLFYGNEEVMGFAWIDKRRLELIMKEAKEERTKEICNEIKAIMKKKKQDDLWFIIF